MKEISIPGRLTLSFLSGLLLVFSLPAFDRGFLAWGGLVPLIVAILSGGALTAFLVSLFAGEIFFGIIFYWTFQVPGYILIHHAILVTYLATSFAFFGLAFHVIAKQLGLVTGVLAAPFVWVALEYARSNLSFLSLPWGLLAHSQYRYLPLIQFASITGTYGISFLLVLLNGAVALAVIRVCMRLGWCRSMTVRFPSKRSSLIMVSMTAGLAAFAVAYGQLTLSKPIVGKEVKVGVVQGNIVQSKKWDPNHANEIVQTYASLTQKAASERPALIVWPETATPASIRHSFSLYAEVKRMAKEADTYILLGSAQNQKFVKDQVRQSKCLNSAFLIRPDSQIKKGQRYDKIHLLPFGEYIPLQGIIPWSWIKVSDMKGCMPGETFTVFELPSFRFGVTICWENIFPDLVRQFVRNGAEFIVNIADEAWFGETAAPYQFLSMSVFRAVENRVYVVRCVNTGVSCFINPYGRVVNRFQDPQGRDIFVRGVLIGDVIPLKSETFYSRYGDWVAGMSLLGSVAFLLGAFVRRKPLTR